MDAGAMKALAKEAAKEAAHEVLQTIGIDTSNPIKTQAEFASMRELALLMKDDRIVADLEFLRRLRGASDNIRDTAWKTVAKVVVTALLGILALGTKDWWLAHIKG
jgi:hypothetical protein